MNPIQAKQRIDFYINLTSTARFLFASYNSAMNDVISEFKNEQLGDEDQRDPKNFDWIQAIRDNLYTLIKTDAPSVDPPVPETNRYFSYGVTSFAYPSDYDSFIYLKTIVDESTTGYARPTSYNLLGPLCEDSYRRPTDNKVYFYENNTGMTLLCGPTTDLAIELTYLRNPDAFSIGAESNSVYAGQILLNTVQYYALEVTNYDGVFYQQGDLITGNGSPIISGMAIDIVYTLPIDLPERVHERMCKNCAVKMLKSIGEFDAAAAIDSEAVKD